MGNEKKVQAEVYGTFDEWNRLGFYIRKGEKSVARSPSGVALFNESQVCEKQDRNDMIGAVDVHEMSAE